MQQALITALLLGVASAVLSCFLVLRGWALMGDAISHAVLPGIVLAYAAGIPVVIGAFLAGIFCTLATGFMTENSRLKEDTVMGVVFSGMFDPQHARAIGLPVSALHYGLLVLLSVVIVAALKVVGIILVIALLIAPGAIGYLMTDRFDAMLLYAVCSAVLASVTGIVVSFVLDSAPAPTIVLMLMIMFILVFLFSPSHGLIGSQFSRRKSATDKSADLANY